MKEITNKGIEAAIRNFIKNAPYTSVEIDSSGNVNYLDSLDLIEIVMEVEKALDITIDEGVIDQDEVDQIETINELTSWIKSRIVLT